MNTQATISAGIEISPLDFQMLLQEKLRLAVQFTPVTVLEEEVTAFVGAERYTRTPERRDQRNGSYARRLGTSVGEVELQVPRTRKGFKTQMFEKYQRRQAEMDQAISAMFVQGVSTARVGEVLGGLTTIQPSASTVSRVFHTLDDEFATWKQRPLDAHYAYAFADGTYFTVIYEATGQKTPILAVVGIKLTGEREVLGFTIGERENQTAWADLLDSLKARGLQKVDLWITDGNQAMLNAIQTKFPDSARQRCIKHKMENVLSYVPEKQQEAVAGELRAIFYQDNRAKAEQAVAAFQAKYETVYPSAVECLQRDLEACLTFYTFPKTHWKTIRTTNVVERLFGEVKKRSHKMAAAFRNESSCLLMFYAVIRSLHFRKLSMHKKEQTQDPDPTILHNS
ncbi:MAG: IS256 family transposase [Anaerolineae bacterium]